MQVAVALLLFAGCNQVYGLDPTRLPSTIDAPPACKDELELVFDPVVVATTGGFPLAYNTDEARTLAVADQFKVVEGPADVDALRPAVFEPVLMMGTTATIPRLAPEGDEPTPISPGDSVAAQPEGESGETQEGTQGPDAPPVHGIPEPDNRSAR